MNSFRSPLNPTLLDGLRQDLDLLDRRLRAGIAEAVGRAVAHAVQDWVLTLVTANPTLRRQPLSSFQPQGYSPAPLWDDSGNELFPGEEEDAPDGWEDQEDAPDQPDARREESPWLPTLETALRVGLWWLACRRSRRIPLWPAAGISLAAALTVLTGNRLLATTVAVALAALRPVTLVNDARAGLEALEDSEDE